MDANDADGTATGAEDTQAALEREPELEAPPQEPTPDNVRFAPPAGPNKAPGGRKWLMIVAVIVLLAVAGAAAYWFTKHKTGKPMPAAAAQKSPNIPAPAASGPSGSSTYTAAGQDLNLSFSYPSNWTATPTSGSDTTDQPITVTSPLVSFTDADNQAVTGRVIVNIRSVSTSISELSANSPVVAQDSNQFAYTAPTANQHQYPYLTYVHFSNGSKTPGAFEEVFITGISSFAKGSPFTSPETDPVISASFYQCTTQACDAGGRQIVSITNATWQNSDPTKQVQNILASLKFN